MKLKLVKVKTTCDASVATNVTATAEYKNHKITLLIELVYP